MKKRKNGKSLKERKKERKKEIKQERTNEISKFHYKNFYFLKTGPNLKRKLLIMSGRIYYCFEQ